jgi:alpha-beta hydrolase superfamily lysophospholipase
MTDVTCKLYKDDRHEILNESDKETIYRDILMWIRERI